MATAWLRRRVASARVGTGFSILGGPAGPVHSDPFQSLKIRSLSAYLTRNRSKHGTWNLRCWYIQKIFNITLHSGLLFLYLCIYYIDMCVSYVLLCLNMSTMFKLELYINTLIFIFAYLHINLDDPQFRWFGTHAYICIYICICIYVYVYIYINMYIYIYICIYIYNSIVILYPYAHDGTFKRGTRCVSSQTAPRHMLSTIWVALITKSPASSEMGGWLWCYLRVSCGFFLCDIYVISIDIYVIFMWYVCHTYLIFVYICVIFMNYKNLHSLKCSAILG